MLIGSRERGVRIDTSRQAARFGVRLQGGTKEFFFQTHRTKTDEQNDIRKTGIVNLRKVAQDRDGWRKESNWGGTRPSGTLEPQKNKNNNNNNTYLFTYLLIYLLLTYFFTSYLLTYLLT